MKYITIWNQPDLNKVKLLLLPPNLIADLSNVAIIIKIFLNREMTASKTVQKDVYI